MPARAVGQLGIVCAKLLEQLAALMCGRQGRCFRLRQATHRRTLSQRQCLRLSFDKPRWQVLPLATTVWGVGGSGLGGNSRLRGKEGTRGNTVLQMAQRHECCLKRACTSRDHYIGMAHGYISVVGGRTRPQSPIVLYHIMPSVI